MTTNMDISDQTVSTTTTTTATTGAADEEVMAVEPTDTPKGKPPFIGSIGDTNGYYLTLTTDTTVDNSKALRFAFISWGFLSNIEFIYFFHWIVF